jgi:hypothetical protein
MVPLLLQLLRPLMLHLGHLDRLGQVFLTLLVPPGDLVLLALLLPQALHHDPVL